MHVRGVGAVGKRPAGAKVLAKAALFIFSGCTLWWALFQPHQGLVERPTTAPAASTAARLSAQRDILMEPLPGPPKALPSSTHTCTQAENPKHRVCQFNNLILYNGSIFYLTNDDEVQVPTIDVKYHKHSEDSFTPEVLRLRDASFLLSEGIEWATITRTWLWKVTQPHPNFGHHFGEDAPTLHNTLCEQLGECSYPPRQPLQFVLLDYGWRGRLVQQVNDTMNLCMSSGPPVYRDDERLLPKAVLLQSAWAGIGPRCRGQKGCNSDEKYGEKRGDKRLSVTPGALRTFRERLGACYGLDVHTPAPLSPKHILVLDRHYESSRHMLNVHSVLQSVRQRFPHDHVKLLYFEDLSFPEQLQVVSRTSIFLMVHGAAIALWPVLPLGAVAIHIVPDFESINALQNSWAEFYAHDYAFANITFVPLNNTEPLRQPLRLEEIVPLEVYQNLTMIERLELLEQGICPERLDDICTFHWKRKQINLVLNLTDLAWALDTAEADLLRKAGKLTQ